MLGIITSLFGGGFCKCLLLAALRDGMWHEGDLRGCSWGFLLLLKIFQVSLSPCSTLFLFLPTFLLAPLLLTRHWGCVAPPTIHKKHRVSGYEYLAKGVQGSQVEMQLLEEMCCFGLYWILGLIKKPALLPHGQAAPASQREWYFYLWSYKSSLHLLFCQSLLPLPATRGYSAAYLLKSPRFIFFYGVDPSCWSKNQLYKRCMMHTHLSGDGREPSKALQGADETFPGSGWDKKVINSSTWGIFPFPPTAITFSFSKTQISRLNLHFHSWEWLQN